MEVYRLFKIFLFRTQYFTLTLSAMASSDSEDDMPLATLLCKAIDKTQNKIESTPLLDSTNRSDAVIDNHVQSDDASSSSDESLNHYINVGGYDSDRDPEYNPGACEVKKCKADVWAACPECEILLCWEHFNEDISFCTQHGKVLEPKVKRRHDKTAAEMFSADEALTIEKGSKNNKSSEATNDEQTVDKDSQEKAPELYVIEGNEREFRHEKKTKINKQIQAKRKRNLGQEYTSVKTKKVVHARQMKARCKGTMCEKMKKMCSQITEEDRKAIFDSYHNLGDLRLQREFLIRHVKINQVKRKYTDGDSRRSKTREYMLTVRESLTPVCKVFFFNTLGISEQSVRTALDKITDTGTVQKDNRGGRQSETVKERDALMRKEISDHIDRFPKVESHYCREKTTKEYLNPELSKRYMYAMFVREWIPRIRPPSFTTYRDVFKSKNLSIHRPKKDQCSLCVSYHQSNDCEKVGLQDKYKKHVGEKERVREIKDQCKKEAQENPNILCASFDLQQVIYLPMSKESAIFYKRRLSIYNLTVYNIADRDCHCFTWDETQSKRGSSEISTSVYEALKVYDNKGMTKAYLFSDGCGGQNKNSITPAMMLYTVLNSKNIEEISLRFFETNHGQNEGDSAHSAIGHALKRAGDLFLPSQVATVMALARPQQPYIVHEMQYGDILDFKGFSKDLRILDAGRFVDDESFSWNNVMELRVMKSAPNKIFYKTSHFDCEFKELSLRRLSKPVYEHSPQTLNAGLTNLSKEKYNDLMALCSGVTPVIRKEQHKTFYVSLPHD